MNSDWDDDDGDDGLPDAAFTEDELAAGVQHMMRTGDPDAASSMPRSLGTADNEDYGFAEDAEDSANVRQSSRKTAPLRFQTFTQAQAWSRANQGKVFVRTADGQGFEPKPTWRTQSVAPHNNSFLLTMGYNEVFVEIKSMAPQLEDVLRNLRPFSRSIWERDLKRLNIFQLNRLRLLAATYQEINRKDLRSVEAEIRRYRRVMIPGNYGEPQLRETIDFMEGIVKDIDKHLTARHGVNQSAVF